MERFNVAVFLSVIFHCLRPILTDELIAVTAVVSHGDTIPSEFYATDPYKDPAIWEKSLGQLSNLGQEQTYTVGQWLRKHYERRNPFITLHYNASQIYTFSEDRDESLMSAECIMAGLYPPVGDEIWNKKIKWRPTPVHTSPLSIDYILGRSAYCPKYDQELNKVKHGRFLRNQDKKESSLLQYLTENTGENFTHISEIPTLYNILTVEQNHGLTLPNWTHAVYPHALAIIVLEDSIMRTKNPELTKLAIGPFFHKIQAQFHAAVSNRSKLGLATDLRKFKLFVSNNTIIYDTLHALKVPSIGVVPFAASLIFELWKTDVGLTYVKLLYRDSYHINTPAKQLKIGGCKSMKCPYVTFNNTLTNFGTNYTQWNQLCNPVIVGNSYM